MFFKKILGVKSIINSNIDRRAIIGSGTKVWENSQVRENAIIGSDCTIARNVYIGPGVKIGNSGKIQNNALMYEPDVLEDGGFIGQVQFLQIIYTPEP